MERIKLTENFYLDEFVDPVTYFTHDDHGLSRIKMSVVNCVQLLRTKLGHSVNVNGWWKHLTDEHVKMFDKSRYNDLYEFEDLMEEKKVAIWSGFRSDRCKIGAKASAHRLTKAADPKGDENEMFKIVCDNAQEFYDLGLRRLEDPAITNGWLHMDVEERNHVPGRIRIIGKTDHIADLIVATGDLIAA